MLNGRRVRLRDVQDMVRTIGIDNPRHIVVNQGMADALLTASPADRRVLLEHAAGLAGYRARRDEARQKLATTAQNVEVIDAVLAEAAAFAGAVLDPLNAVVGIFGRNACLGPRAL